MIHVVEKDAANLSTPSGPGVNIPQFLVLIFSDPIYSFHEGNESFFFLSWGAIIISGGCFIILISEDLAASESSTPLYLDSSNPSHHESLNLESNLTAVMYVGTSQMCFSLCQGSFSVLS